MPDELWDEIRVILPLVKPNNTIGRPAVSFRKVLDGILYVLRTGCQWKMFPKEYGSSSTYHRRFQQWSTSKVFERLWTRLELSVTESCRSEPTKFTILIHVVHPDDLFHRQNFCCWYREVYCKSHMVCIGIIQTLLEQYRLAV